MRLLFIGLPLLFAFSCAHQHSHHHRFDDAQKWAKIFESKERDAWQKPDEVIKALKLRATDKVTDIGAGTGYFPVRIAKEVSKGRVYAGDIEPNLIRFLTKRKKKEDLTNFYPLLGETHDPLIPEKMNLIMMVDTYHHISERVAYFNRLKADLKKEGRLVIIDFKKGDLPLGPKDKMKISRLEVIKELEKAGYKLEREEDFLPYQYFLFFSAL